MNVFEELVEELKVENLLEYTVIDGLAKERLAAPLSTFEMAFDSELLSEATPTATFHNNVYGESQDALDSGFAPADLASDSENEAASYRKTVVDEIASLQMVEHVLSGIESEYMQIAPATFNDLLIKKVLHTFLKGSETASSEHLEAEGIILCETEAWHEALAKRDAEISVANIRRFCENSRPVLSSQALLALAKFYRNSPASEPVRGKFDFVMTRLFSRDGDEEKRRLLFGTIEMVRHINDLYADWGEDSHSSSGPKVAETLVAFRRAIEEAETADGFDELIDNDFFNRTRRMKESAGDTFFVPDVVAAAIECNVKIGNRIVDLLSEEKQNCSADELEEKYGYNYDSAVSGAASKTLLLADIVKSDAPDFQPPEIEAEAKICDSRPAPQLLAIDKKLNGEGVDVQSMFAVNRWLLAVCLLMVLCSIGLYFFSESYSKQQSPATVAADLSLEDSGVREHIRFARTSNETLYGVIQPSWTALAEGPKKEFLEKTLIFARSRGLRRVNLLNEKGRTVAFASDNRLDLVGP